MRFCFGREREMDIYVNAEELRLKIAALSDDEQRRFMRELIIDTHVGFHRHLQEEADTKVKVDRMDIAMFATDDKNEFGRRGFMDTFNRLDAFLDVSCKIAAAIKSVALWIIAIGAAGAAIAKWLKW